MTLSSILDSIDSMNGVIRGFNNTSIKTLKTTIVFEPKMNLEESKKQILYLTIPVINKLVNKIKDEQKLFTEEYFNGVIERSNYIKKEINLLKEVNKNTKNDVDYLEVKSLLNEITYYKDFKQKIPEKVILTSNKIENIFKKVNENEAVHFDKNFSDFIKEYVLFDCEIPSETEIESLRSFQKLCLNQL